MTNIAQMVNVLQAMILTDNERMIRTPTYYVFRMYKVHQGATRIPVELNASRYVVGDSSIPAVSASASRDAAGRIHLSIVNLEPDRSAEVTTTVAGLQIRRAGGEILTAPAINAMNTFERPDVVAPAPFSKYRIAESRLILDLPAKSVVVMELE
jgi:alpha-N-arabinofuranosidase